MSEKQTFSLRILKTKNKIKKTKSKNKKQKFKTPKKQKKPPLALAKDGYTAVPP
jgi:hypothetical protein